ncbi:MAG TPA: nitroreductase/quinone reductase family protein [Conexibacter sp.]|nr:nitroreductase/quinone reductase family protein [Conexibacter sp.]
MAARYLPPNWLFRRLANPLARRLGLATTLLVPTRASGRLQALPVNVLHHDGRDYLVSVRGESQWVRNLRASGACELRRRGRARRCTVEEVPVEQRAPIVAAYRRRWDYQAAPFFLRLPQLADHPVFALRDA